MNIGPAGIALIKSFEGLRLKAYQDQVGVWTIGYGSTKGVTEGMTITEAQAEALLVADLADAEHCVNSAVTVPLTQKEYDALVSWVFNLGCGTLRKSSVLRLLNDSDYDGAAQAMKLYNKAGGQVVAGLERRRTAEVNLFESA